MQTKLTVLREDLTFKMVFSEEKFITDLINSFLAFLRINRKVTLIDVTPQSLLKASMKKGKLFFGDVVAILDDGTLVSLEMYNLFREEEFKKSLGYITRKFSSQLEVGEKHLEAKKVMGISLMEGNFNLNNFRFINDYGFINKSNYGVIKNEYLELYLVRLDLIPEIKYTYRKEERFIKWMHLINARSIEEMAEISKGDEVMEATVQFVKNFLSDEEILETYDKMTILMDQAEEAGEKKGLEKGQKKGEKSERIVIARKMLQDNQEIEMIRKYTGLSKKEIEALK